MALGYNSVLQTVACCSPTRFPHRLPLTFSPADMLSLLPFSLPICSFSSLFSVACDSALKYVCSVTFGWSCVSENISLRIFSLSNVNVSSSAWRLCRLPLELRLCVEAAAGQKLERRKGRRRRVTAGVLTCCLAVFRRKTSGADWCLTYRMTESSVFIWSLGLISSKNTKQRHRDWHNIRNKSLICS